MVLGISIKDRKLSYIYFKKLKVCSTIAQNGLKIGTTVGPTVINYLYLYALILY